MRPAVHFVCFGHSLVSDWNHGNAHFLRGVVRELQARGHRVQVLEPRDGWSRAQLIAEHGRRPLELFASAFPDLRSTEYDLDTLDLDTVLDGADVVLVHEWNEPELIARLGRHRAGGGRYLLLFHDTHHRSVSAASGIDAIDLEGFDGVLAFGEAVREIYLRRGWARRAWTWHEAADTTVFHPVPGQPHEGDLVWIGNWGDDERTAELGAFLLEPVQRLGLSARVFGVRYPHAARQALSEAGISFGGWLPNAQVPAVFARHKITVHVPRRPYVEALPGIPTVRVFEALACGIPLICAPWRDVEGLFRSGRDFLVANDSQEMTEALRAVLNDPTLAAELSRSGLETIRERHTCAHRVDQLLAICGSIGARGTPAATAGAA